MKHFPPQLALALSSLFWSGNFIVGRALRDNVPAIPLNYWRWIIALIILLPFSFKLVRQNTGLLIQHWRFMFILAITGIAGFHIAVYQALHTTTAINAVLFLSISPVMIVIGSRLIFHERIQTLQIMGIIISLGGVVVLLTHATVDNLLALHLNHGDLWMLLAVVLWSIYSVILKQKPQEMPQTVLINGVIIYGIVIMTPLYLMTASSGNNITIDSSTVIGLLYIGIFASIAAYFCWNYGVSKLGPNKAGTYLHLIPLFGAVLSILLLGEQIHSYHIAGAVLIALGIILANRKIRP